MNFVKLNKILFLSFVFMLSYFPLFSVKQKIEEIIIIADKQLNQSKFDEALINYQKVLTSYLKIKNKDNNFVAGL